MIQCYPASCWLAVPFQWWHAPCKPWRPECNCTLPDPCNISECDGKLVVWWGTNCSALWKVQVWLLSNVACRWAIYLQLGSRDDQHGTAGRNCTRWSLPHMLKCASQDQPDKQDRLPLHPICQPFSLGCPASLNHVQLLKAAYEIEDFNKPCFT